MKPARRIQAGAPAEVRRLLTEPGRKAGLGDDRVCHAERRLDQQDGRMFGEYAGR